MDVSISLGQNFKDWVDYFSAFSPFLIGLITIWFYYWNANKQKEQWLNDALIKNEFNVLLQMKRLLSKNLVSINWYFNYILAKYIYEEDELLHSKDFIVQMHIHHPRILELYNFYRENYYIFEKYNLLNELKIITFMMQISRILDEDKYGAVVVKQTKEGDFVYWEYEFSEKVQYLLGEWIKENRIDLINVKDNCKNKCKNNCDNCTNNEVAFDILHKEMYWLMHKFDKLTLANSKKEFNLKDEINKICIFEPYTNLKNKGMTAKEKKETNKIKEKIKIIKTRLNELDISKK